MSPPGSSLLRRSLESVPTILRKPLLVEPDVFHPPSVEDAIDHQDQPLHVRLTTRPAAAVEDDWSGIVVRPLPFDVPHQLLSFLLVCFARLPTNQLLYLGIAIIVSVKFRTTA